MKKKINLSLKYDSPVTITFVVVSLIIFLVDSFILKGKLNASILASPTNAKGSLLFTASSPLSYFRTILFVFGYVDFSALFGNLIFILLLGPALEDYYGPVLVGVSYAASAIFSGILNACFCVNSLHGCSCIVMMMIFLCALMSFAKNSIPLSSILVLILYLLKELYAIGPDPNTNGLPGLFISIAGAVFASLIAYILLPLVRKNKGEGLMSKAERIRELDEESPRNSEKPAKTKKKKDDDDETTIVGTITF